MSKTENKSGKCKNCSAMHDKCDKKMDATKSDCKKQNPAQMRGFICAIFYACTNRVFIISMLYQVYLPKGV